MDRPIYLELELLVRLELCVYKFKVSYRQGRVKADFRLMTADVVMMMWEDVKVMSREIQEGKGLL